ncbi:MAG: alpha/beta fold hydrolase [Actinobacteria bacterium]|nr:alpha/beta fold hydrolase [Actinomycetota bacterium]
MVFTVRTPDERFDDLPDWPYEPRYVEVEGLRLARVDEGPRDGHPVVLVHGEPTWGYLWRHVLPPLHEAGLRTIVPDQVGFGRSDKPGRRDWFTYDRLVDSFDAHIRAIDPDPVTLVVHDWGGVVGLRWAVENPERVARLVLLNTGLWTKGGRHSDAWLAFHDWVQGSEELPVGDMVQGGAATELPHDVIAAYEAPFPGPEYQAGVVALPVLVPIEDTDPGADEMTDSRAKLADWEAPTYVLWGRDDPILPPRVGERFVHDIPGAEDLDTVAGMHFLQEDAGPEIGRRIADFVERTS